MKKLIKLLLITSFSTPISLSVVACNRGQPDWNNIPIPPPEIPIDVSGFDGVDFKTMNIKDYITVDQLFDAIKDKLKHSIWKDESSVTWTGTKNGKTINLATEDLKRNAQYSFEITSNISVPGDAKFIITIKSSRHIADNIPVTSLGKIHGYEIKTILFSLVFQNMNLVPLINEMAEEYLSNIKINDTHTSATLTSPDGNYYFYGSVTVTFTPIKVTPPSQPKLLSDVIKNRNLGEITDNRLYTVLKEIIMQNITNFPSLDELPEFINNVEINVNADNSAILKAVNDTNDFYKGSVDLKFTINKN